MSDPVVPPDLPAWLTARLRAPMPDDAIRARFAPALSYGRHFGPAAHDARPAAVMLLLYERDGQWHLPFTVRPETMLSHAGQISLPGGMVESGESTQEAALRELEEELGVPRSTVEVVGCLSPLYVFVSNFQVTPWVAFASGPVAFQPCDQEVAEVLEVPLTHLLDIANHSTHAHRSGHLRFSAPHFAWGTHRVWGATSMILAELVAILADSPESAIVTATPPHQGQ